MACILAQQSLISCSSSTAHLQKPFILIPPCSCSFFPGRRNSFICSSLTISSLSKTNLQLVEAATQNAEISTLMLQEVDFAWKGQGSEVLLTGDFLNWDTKLALEKGSDGMFHLKQKLRPGSYLFKFIVDGKWMHSDDIPTVPDGKGGFNNQIVITETELRMVDAVNTTLTDAKLAEETAEAAGTETRKPKVTVPDRKPDKAVGKVARETGSAVKGPRKGVKKPLPILMDDDIIPVLKTNLQGHHSISNLDVTFKDNQLQGCFIKNGIPYSFWAYFPDGELEGSRGFSLSSHGSPPSTVEPFLIDEKRITPELVVFWITKRLFAQNLLSLN